MNALKQIVNHRYCDKGRTHTYLDKYEEMFSRFRDVNINFLEIGVFMGGSVMLWKEYFNNANLYFIDNDKIPKWVERDEDINLIKANAYSIKVVESLPVMDIIIDDGSHKLDDMLFVIDNYSNLLSSSGMLILEDVQDVAWLDIFDSKLPKGFKREIVDNRHLRGRYDDILYIIKRDDT